MKQLLKKLFAVVQKCLAQNISPAKLALSCAIGMYISFSPFIGLHFVMTIVATRLLGLNFPLTLLVASFNNPWTMIPYYTSGYFVGHYLLHNLLHFEPTWIVSLERVWVNGSLCMWSFLLGGNVLGLISAIITYPIAKQIFSRLMSQKIAQGAA